VSIDRRLPVSDNLGWQPCLDPVALGKLMERVCNGKRPSLRARIIKGLAAFRRKLA
jgi:hypothetical protein